MLHRMLQIRMIYPFLELFFDRIYFCDLNIEVEILDEEEFEYIDKLDIEDNAMNRSERYIRKSDNKLVTLSVSDYVLANKINQLIKNQKKIIERKVIKLCIDYLCIKKKIYVLILCIKNI